MPAEPPITFEVLRQVAEAASGYRYQTAYIAVSLREDGSTVVSASYERPAEQAGTVIYEVAPVGYPPPPMVTEATIASGEVKMDLLKLDVPPIGIHPGGTYHADAVFWSVSAVEKFLSPYYASVFGDQGGEVVEVLLRMLRPDPSPEGVEPPPDAVTVDEDPPFAIAHLPSSEYVANPAFGVTGTRMFTLHRSGAVHPVPHPAGRGERNG